VGAAFDRRQHCHQRYNSLAAADIALQQPHHAPRLGHLGGDFGDRQALCASQAKAKRLFDWARQFAGLDNRPPLLAMTARADQRHRELAGEDFVIGQPLARRHGWP